MRQVILTSYFLKQSKSLFKKYRHLKAELIEALNNFIPDSSICLGHQLYKVRLQSYDLPKGKSKSFRLIVFLFQHNQVITPIYLYFKGNKININRQEIEDYLKMVIAELEWLTKKLEN
jgi:hypothetical protein